MSTISEWVNDPRQFKNHLTAPGGAYKVNSTTGGVPVTVDPRWFNLNPDVQQKIKRNKFVKNGWKSPVERFNNYNPYVLHFKFKKEVRINHIIFELLDYSQEWSFSYYDSYRNKMVPIQFPISDKKSNLQGKIRANSGVWKLYDYDVVKFKTNIIEVRLQRNWQSTSFGSPPPNNYSLGLKNLALKFMGDGTEGLPEDNVVPGPHGFDEVIAFTHYDAYNAIDNSNYSTEGDGGPSLYLDSTPDNDLPTGILDESTIVANTDSYWLSAPQGAAESAVSLYVDIRDSNLEASAFNMIRMLPIQTGPKMSIYYSDDDTVTSFAVSKNKFNLQSDATGSPVATIKSRVKGLGYYVNDTYNYSLDNEKMGLSLLTDFVIGTEVSLTENAEVATERCIWNIVDEESNNGISLVFYPESWVAQTSVTGSLRVMPWTYAPGNPSASDALIGTAIQVTFEYDEPYGIVVAFNYPGSDSTLQLAGWNVDVAKMTGNISDDTYPIDYGRYDVDNEFTFSPATDAPAKLIIGNNDNMDAPAHAYIRRIWVKQDTYFRQTSRAFFADAESFINAEIDGPNSRRGVLYNAVAVGDFVNSGLALLGHNGGWYANKEWVPIPKDFVLMNTDFDLGQTYKAKYLKFEFTGLMPRWYYSSRPLPVRGFPLDVRKIIDSIYEEQASYYDSNVYVNRFEAPVNTLNPIPKPGFKDLNLAMRNTSDVNNFIFQSGLGSYDIIGSLPTDVINLRRELNLASVHTKFPIAGRHTYETRWVPSENKKAYFVGIKNLQIFRTTQNNLMDDPEIYDFIDDELQIDTNNSELGKFQQNLNCYFSTLSATSFPDEYSAVLTTKAYPSYSKFRTIQMATLDTPWQTCMGETVVNLETTDFLESVNCATEFGYPFVIVTDSYQGNRGGEVVLVARDSTNYAVYGVATKPLVEGAVDNPQPVYPGNLSNTPSFPMIGAQTSAAVRMFLPETTSGRYQLRLWEANTWTSPAWRLAVKKDLNIPARQWFEEEITYMPAATTKNWYTEIVQVDPTCSEPFLVDMLGIWQKPVKWEVTNNPDDNNPKWHPILFVMNNPNAYFSFPYNDYGNFGTLLPENEGGDGIHREPMRLAIRATVKNPLGGTLVSAYQVIPWYEESPITNRAPIDYNPPWGNSDDDVLRAVIHKPLFQGWHHFFPLNDSTVFQEFPYNKYNF